MTVHYLWGIDKIISNCNIPMPVDAKRNMMNASSNFEIIQAILGAVRTGKKTKTSLSWGIW